MPGRERKAKRGRERGTAPFQRRPFNVGGRFRGAFSLERR